jgi:23S rRNA (adenine2503-C2)-methyltransferase
MRALTEYNLEELAEELSGLGYPASHARRLLGAFYRGGGQLDLAALPLGVGLRERLARELPPRPSRLLRRVESQDGTVKLLLGFTRGGAAEVVLMPAYRPGYAAGCVSSQIGCAMGCDFCASTKRGLERSLEAAEIVEQFVWLSAEAQALGRRLRTLVFMGMGEPMHNLDNVLAAIPRIADQAMGGLGRRAITVSTVGVVPGIERLAEADLNVHLAVSLHAPDDETRARLVPMNRRYPVADIMTAARGFQQKTGRVVTLEYCLLDGVNDSEAQAEQLAVLMAGFRAHVNLIPYNAIGPGKSGIVYARPSNERLQRFITILRERRVVAHFRDTRGSDVAAACGQLREIAAPGDPTTPSL